ncbi:hypothetical protein [Wenjunlia tyrosinilytica]|uniref:Uncharacterized protein n=1 Tax=Wenjunlia tyrosinilytica TaxID=1544741 RepID=A0A918E226_9ACTN|nr:hypothetical protein [Wenjunlia tyrosinilytica]GGO98210.1 hypothetical protein GCM10012280_61810 [Wenjunlia tyrosinilytica]
MTTVTTPAQQTPTTGGLLRGRSTLPFTRVPNLAARDHRITWRARGLLLELLSYPPGWRTTIDEMVKRAQHTARETGGRVEGRDAMRAAARELKRAGYLIVHRHQDPGTGQWTTTTVITEAPLLTLALEEQQPTPAPAESTPATRAPTPSPQVSPNAGFPGVGSPGAGKPGAITKTEKKKETPPLRPSPPPDHARARTRTADGRKDGHPRQAPDPQALKILATIAATAPVFTLGAHAQHRQAPRITAALTRGYTPAQLTAALTTRLDGIRHPESVMANRLDDLLAAPGNPQQHRRDPAAPARPHYAECPGNDGMCGRPLPTGAALCPTCAAQQATRAA